MKKLLIGSSALNNSFDDFRVANDTDIVCSYEQAINTKNRIKCKSFFPINDGKTIYMKSFDNTIFEFEITWENSMADKLIEFVKNNMDSVFETNNLLIAKPNLIYLLKCSHKYKRNSPHFLKTMQDIKWLEEKGCYIPEEWMEFFKEREKDTYNYSLPKLNVKKDDFFNEEVTSVFQLYDHDTLHEALKHLERPAYTYFKPEDEEVWCSRYMFEQCREGIKLYSVLEESLVLACERSLTCYPDAKPRKAFETALMKVCTSIASGFWREYAWNNYEKVIALYETLYPNDEYYGRVLEGVQNGVVKLKENV